jgi:hypothetical protein
MGKKKVFSILSIYFFRFVLRKRQKIQPRGTTLDVVYAIMHTPITMTVLLRSSQLPITPSPQYSNLSYFLLQKFVLFDIF